MVESRNGRRRRAWGPMHCRNERVSSRIVRYTTEVVVCSDGGRIGLRNEPANAPTTAHVIYEHVRDDTFNVLTACICIRGRVAMDR